MEDKRSCRLELPVPPSVNRIWRHVGYRVLLSREGRIYREQVAAIVRPLHIPTFTSPLSVELDVYPSTHRSYDLDNRMKGLLDALQYAGVIENDSQVVRLLSRKGSVIRGGLVIVRIEEVDASVQFESPPQLHPGSSDLPQVR